MPHQNCVLEVVFSRKRYFLDRNKVNYVLQLLTNSFEKEYTNEEIKILLDEYHLKDRIFLENMRI